MIKDVILATVDYPEFAETGQLARGLLFYGPPGTGKSFLALAAASKPRSPAVYFVLPARSTANTVEVARRTLQRLKMPQIVGDLTRWRLPTSRACAVLG